MRIIFALCLLTSTQIYAQSWQPLFNGKSLSNWKQHGGKATYKVEDETIVSTAIPNSPNSFLYTKSSYGDFILELEVMVDNRLNSGIQFRSQINGAGTLVGYQCDIDPSDRKFTGGIFDEQNRGWLYPLSRNPKAQSAFRKGEWNSIRIECYGNSIQTYVNGMMCSRLIDDMASDGIIALQVHSIPEKDNGLQVRWRDIKILTEDVAEYLSTPDPTVSELSYLKNQLTDWETNHGWRLLWDGQSTDGWRGAKLDEFPNKGWKMENGELTVLASDGGESTGGGDIVTTRNYSNFELELEFKITEGANSGIKYFVDPSLNKGSGSAIGCEFQVLDDVNHPDAKKGVEGNRTVGSLYDLITAKNLSVEGRSKQFKGIDKWNKAYIIAKDGHVEHWLNNEKVVEYERFSQMFEALVNYSKYAGWENFGRWPEGCILLQDHGNEVSYRSIKIREL
ncbi:DUF1080 domain-containing protein [Marinoscillum sp. MHG1-6]|uniref:3-keto-disaccharide hydrolase n=1 Tax=Marinoscillum sp. MHG1-6 TaxID=2959627 RepID=UPI002157D68E|nr:DUF1080 domain-containing protein [Marinoscillum sp. MHG1-6]